MGCAGNRHVRALCGVLPQNTSSRKQFRALFRAGGGRTPAATGRFYPRKARCDEACFCCPVANALLKAALESVGGAVVPCVEPGYLPLTQSVVKGG